MLCGVFAFWGFWGNKSATEALKGPVRWTIIRALPEMRQISRKARLRHINTRDFSLPLRNFSINTNGRLKTSKKFWHCGPYRCR